jgi:drug/metabolite transporter (DMT)-like permease
MTWFWLALAAAFLWSINNHLDKYVAERYYRRSTALPGTLMFLTSGLGLCIALAVVLTGHSVSHVPITQALILVSAGIVDFAYVFPYILALMKDEASRVAPLFQLAPAVSAVLAWVFLHEHLSSVQIGAIMLVIIGSIAISLDASSGFRLKRDVLVLMAISASLWALETFLFKFVARSTGYWPAVFYQYLGAAIAGLLLAAISPRYRRDFLTLVNHNRRSVFTVSLLAEVISATARMSLSYASLLAPLAIVTVVANVQPFFVIGIGVVLTLVWPTAATEDITRRHVTQKLMATAVMFLGTYLLLK